MDDPLSRPLIELIQMLVTAGYHADRSAFIFQSIFSNKMENAIHYAIMKDDVEVMRILRPALYETSIKKLFKMAGVYTRILVALFLPEF